MSNFIRNATTIPGPKVEWDGVSDPATRPDMWVSPADYNAIRQALLDTQATYREFVDVKNFGAIGDGVANDTAAIAAAITQASLSFNGVYGGMVYFPKGTYRITAPLVLPNGVGLRGADPVSAIIRASGTADVGGAFNDTVMIRNSHQGGLQEFAFLEQLTIDGNKLGGALISEAVVSWGSLFINSYIRDVIIFNSPSIGLRVFAKSGAGGGGASGPVLFHNIWLLRSQSHGLYVEDEVSNVGGMKGLVFFNLTSEHQGNDASAIYLKGRDHLTQMNFYNTHIEQGDAWTGRTCITIDGASHVQFHGVQLQTGNPATMSAGVRITNDFRNVGIQIHGLTNINLINPVLEDIKNSYTAGAVNIPIYHTPDIVQPGLPVSPANGKSIRVLDSSAVDRVWFETNGRMTGNSFAGGALDVVGDATNNRTIIMLPADLGRAIGWFFPDGSAIRLRNFSGGADFLQFANNGNMFVYGTLTQQGAATFQSATTHTGLATFQGSVKGAGTAGAAPSTGAHVVGEIVLNADPTAGGFIGWVCVTAGTPGTWKSFGLISV